jgi:hypothetical protein
MKNIVYKFLIVLCIFSITLPFHPKKIVHADSPVYPDGGIISPRIPIDCGVDATNPKKSNGKVKGTATISCDTKHSSLKIVVQVLDSNGTPGGFATKICYNADSCSATGSLPFKSGRYWATAASGYYNGNQNLYYETEYKKL